MDDYKLAEVKIIQSVGSDVYSRYMVSFNPLIKMMCVYVYK